MRNHVEILSLRSLPTVYFLYYLTSRISSSIRSMTYFKAATDSAQNSSTVKVGSMRLLYSLE